MAQGIVKFFKPEKGWGAIISPAMPDGLDAFAHYTLRARAFGCSAKGSASSSTTAGQLPIRRYLRASALTAVEPMGGCEPACVHPREEGCNRIPRVLGEHAIDSTLDT